MDKKPILLISAVVVGLILITVVATFTSTSPQSAQSAAKDPPVVPAPTLSATKWDPSKPVPKKVAWETTFEGALKKSEATGKPVMVDFFATWCGPCKYLEAKIYTNKDVIIESTNFINVKVDADKHPDIHAKYQVEGLPTIAWLDAQGNVIKRLQGAPATPDMFADEMRKAHLQAVLGTSL